MKDENSNPNSNESGQSPEKLSGMKMSLFHMIGNEINPSGIRYYDVLQIFRSFSSRKNEVGIFMYGLKRLLDYCQVESRLSQKEALDTNYGQYDSAWTFDDRGRCVQITFKDKYDTFSSAFEYTDHDLISRVDLSFYTGDYSMTITPTYNNDLTVQSISIVVSTRGDDENFTFTSRFDQDGIPEMFHSYNLMNVFDDLSNVKLQLSSSTEKAEIYYSGIIYDDFESLRDALIIFGEGNIRRHSSFSAHDVKMEPFNLRGEDREDFNILKEEHSVTEFVDNLLESIKEYPYKRHFDYDAWFNNFFKTTIKIDQLPDGKFKLMVREGARRDAPEKELAQATLMDRQISSLGRDYLFPFGSRFFYCGGIRFVKDALAEIPEFLNPELDLLNFELFPHYYLYQNLQDKYDHEARSIVRSKELHSEQYSQPSLEIDLEYCTVRFSLDLPVNSRLQFQLATDEDGKRYLQDYDAWWWIGPEQEGLAGRIEPGFDNSLQIPKLSVSIVPKEMNEETLNKVFALEQTIFKKLNELDIGDKTKLLLSSHG